MEGGQADGSHGDDGTLEDHQERLIVRQAAVEAGLELSNAVGGADDDGGNGEAEPCGFYDNQSMVL
jgi:hypothetical protein